MTDIYNQHKAAFAQVEAHAIMRDGELVATIAFKFPRDGAGRLYAYVHWIGLEMVRGFASGGGYDKRTAACASAERSMGAAPIRNAAELATFREALALAGGNSWDRALRGAGFTVHQAV